MSVNYRIKAYEETILLRYRKLGKKANERACKVDIGTVMAIDHHTFG
jgi:hypothetical protein